MAKNKLDGGLIESVNIAVGYDVSSMKADEKAIVESYQHTLKEMLKKYKFSKGKERKLMEQSMKEQLGIVTEMTKRISKIQCDAIKQKTNEALKGLGREYQEEIKIIKKVSEAKRKQAKEDQTFMNKLGAGVKGAMFNMTKYAIAGLPFAAAMGIGTYIKDLTVGGAELNKQMFKLKAITGATGTQMKQMAVTIRSVGAQFGYSAKEVGSFVESLAKMGMSAGDINKSASAIAAFAKITGSDLSKSAEVVTQTIRAFGREFDEADYFVNEMTKTINGSALTLDKYATIMGYVASAAQETGTSFEQTNSMVMLLTNSGLKASQVGTSLRNIMGKMSTEGRSLYSVLEELSQKTYTYADAVEDVGTRGANALTILVNKYKELEKYTRNNLLNTSTAEGAAAIMMESPLARLQKGANMASIYAETAIAGTLGGYDVDFAKNIYGKTDQEKMQIANNIIGSIRTRDKFSGIDIEKAGGFEQVTKLAVEEMIKESPQLATALGLATGTKFETKYTGGGRYRTYEQIVKEARANDEAINNLTKLGKEGFDRAIIAKFVQDASDEVAKQTEVGNFTHLYTGGNLDAMKSAQQEYGEAVLRGSLMSLGLSEAEIDKALKSNSGNILNPNMNDFTTKEANVKRLGEIEESIAERQSKTDFNTTDFKKVEELKEEMKTVLEFLCAAYGKDSIYCKKLSGNNGGKPKTKPMQEASALDTAIKKLKDDEAAAYSVYQESMSSLSGLEGTEAYKEYQRKFKMDYNESMKGILDKLDGDLEIALDLTEKSIDSYEKDLMDYYADKIANTMDAAERDTLIKNRDVEVENLKASKSGLGSKAATAGKFVRGRFDRVMTSNTASGFSQTATDASILNLLEKITESEFKATTGLASNTASIDALKQQQAENLNPLKQKYYIDEIEKLEKAQFDANKKYHEERIKYYDELAALYEDKQKELDSQYEANLRDIKADREQISNSSMTSEQKNVALIKLDKRKESISSTYKTKSTEYRKGKDSAAKTSETSKNEASKSFGDKTKETISTVLSETTEIQDAALSIYQSFQDRMLQATIDRIEKEIQMEEEKYDKSSKLNAGALELGLVSQSDYAAKQIEIENEFNERKNALLEEQFEAEKAAELKRAKLNLAQRLAEIAMNVLLSSSKQGIVGLIGAPIVTAAFSAAAIAQSAVEMNAIKQKEYIPNKFANGGWIKGDSHANGGVPFTVAGKAGFEAEGGEFMVRKYSAKKYSRELEAINNDTFNSSSYFNKNEEVTSLLRVIAQNSESPVRAYVTSKDLKNDEIARKSINQKVRVNG